MKKATVQLIRALCPLLFLVLFSVVLAITLLHPSLIATTGQHALHTSRCSTCKLAAFPSLAPSMSRLRSSTAFQLLQAAQHQLNASTTSNQQQPRHLQLEAHCQVSTGAFQGVLTAVAASQAAHATNSSSRAVLGKEQARAAAVQLRGALAREWMSVLQPFAHPVHHSKLQRNEPAVYNSTSRCQSVGLVPRSTASSRDAVKHNAALLLVLGSWDSLERMLGLYAINLYTIWCYARLHGYGLELYVHGEPLPHAMPVYFIKVLGLRHLFDSMGYQHVLYLDMDSFTHPSTAPPLSQFYAEAPAASLLLQAEDNICAAALLWHNTPDAQLLLQAWWDVGAAGCCPTFPHDQTALKHMLFAYAANITGQAWLYPAMMQRQLKLPAQHPLQQAADRRAGVPSRRLLLQPTLSRSQVLLPPAAAAAAAAAIPAVAASTARLLTATATAGPAPMPLKELSTDETPHDAAIWASVHPLMQQAQSAWGLVRVDMYAHPAGGVRDGKQATYNKTVLRNCLGMWWGCVPVETPALLYHTGHWGMEKLSEPWVADRLLHSAWDWSITVSKA